MPVGVWHAAGLFLVCNWVTGINEGGSEDKSAAENFGAALAKAVIIPALMLGMGAIYHAMMA